MRDEMTDTGSSYQDQNVGYLELPQPLGVGVYVLAEVDPPAGYARSKPIAIEVYSDKITYYKEGARIIGSWQSFMRMMRTTRQPMQTNRKTK